MPDNNVANQVLQMIAQQQRDMHAENQKNRSEDRRLLEQVSEDIGEVKTDFALLNKDVSELKIWRDRVADPHIHSMSRTSAMSSGAFKERAKNIGYATLIIGGIWALLSKFGAAISLLAAKVFQ